MKNVTNEMNHHVRNTDDAHLFNNRRLKGLDGDCRSTRKRGESISAGRKNTKTV